MHSTSATAVTRHTLEALTLPAFSFLSPHPSLPHPFRSPRQNFGNSITLDVGFIMDNVASVRNLRHVLSSGARSLIYVLDPEYRRFPNDIKLYKGDTLVIEVRRGNEATLTPPTPLHPPTPPTPPLPPLFLRYTISHHGDHHHHHRHNTSRPHHYSKNATTITTPPDITVTNIPQRQQSALPTTPRPSTPSPCTCH